MKNGFVVMLRTAHCDNENDGDFEMVSRSGMECEGVQHPGVGRIVLQPRYAHVY